MNVRERIDVAAALRGPAIGLLSALSLLVAMPVFGVDEQPTALAMSAAVVESSAVPLSFMRWSSFPSGVTF